MALTAKSPEEHRFIGETEKLYIQDKTKDAVANQKNKVFRIYIKILILKSKI